MPCPSSCQSATLLQNPTAGCDTSLRYKTLSRIAFFSCALVLPSPIQGQVEPLFRNGTIVASMPLGNIVVNDPTIEENMVDECSPMDRRIGTREITFEDRFAVTAQVGSPAIPEAYFDYNFWQNKNDLRQNLAYMLIYCDGDVVIPLTPSGEYMTASFLVYLAFQKPTTQGGTWTEFKKGSVIFQGDPFNFASAKPVLNLITEGIIL